MRNPHLALRDERQHVLSLRSTRGSILMKGIEEQRHLTAAESKDLRGVDGKIEEAERKILAFEEDCREFDRRVETAKANVSGGGVTVPYFESGPFASFGEQLQAVVKAANGNVDPRLIKLAPSGASEGIPSDGGYTVQQAFAYDLLNAGMVASKFAQRCSRFPVPSRAAGIDLPSVSETSRATGSRLGGIRAYWGSEGGQITGSKPKFRSISLKLGKLTALMFATDELIQDANVLEAFIRRAFPGEFAFTIDDAILRGDGVAKPMGVFNSAALITVSKETSQANDTIVYDNIVRMYARLSVDSYDRAVWFIHQSVLPQLLTMSLVVGTGGGPVFLPANTGAAARPFNTLLGLPVVITEQNAPLGDKGDILLADFGRYLIADKPMESASSMHVRFEYGEQAFRFVYRVDGQPEPHSAVTPYQGADTTSPFVVLEAR